MSHGSDALPALMVLGFVGFIILLSVGMLVLWLVALIHAIRNPYIDSNTRVVWVLLIVFLPAIGSILYLLVGRRA